ncbi:hypothetical protein MASR1M31_03400 [Porphyromonadaceae bacterium]
MKTIQEAANICGIQMCDKYGMTIDMSIPCEDSFEAGVKFAEEWITIEDEIPENGVLVLLKFDNDDTLVSTGLHNGKIFCPDFIFGTSDKVTHWRPLNRK